MLTTDPCLADLDLPPGMSHADCARLANAPPPRGEDPLQAFVIDLLPAGWKIDTDCGPDIKINRADGTSTGWLKPRELNVTPVSRSRPGVQGLLEYASDVRRMVRALLALEPPGYRRPPCSLCKRTAAETADKLPCRGRCVALTSCPTCHSTRTCASVQIPTIWQCLNRSCEVAFFDAQGVMATADALSRLRQTPPPTAEETHA